MSDRICVVKISGHCLDNDALLRQFAGVIAQSAERIVVVHGGGKEITQLQHKLAIEPRYVDGLRVTDADSMALVEMVLCGSVNKRLVRYLLNAGVDAQGLSGVDRGMVCARQMQHEAVDMGFTGTVESVRGEVIMDLFELGVTPVIAPVSVGDDSNFNLNADPVAGAIAEAVSADSVVFISNVAGVLVDGEQVSRMTRPEAEAYIAEGEISGGMIPKVRAALDVLASGVPQAVITDLDGWANDRGTTLMEAKMESAIREE